VRFDLNLGRFAVGSEDFISPRETPTVRDWVRREHGLDPIATPLLSVVQDLRVYKELLELLPATEVHLSAVLPDESGPAVALPGGCRLTRAEGHGEAQHKPLLLIGTRTVTSRTRCSMYASRSEGTRCC
jgi:hypothetical protein